MKKLVIFGDSYADKVRGGPTLDKIFAWYDHLAEKLNLTVLHYGRNASSIEFSMNKLYEYINSSEYSEQDIIIFVSTSLSRSPIIHNDVPDATAGKWVSYLNGSLSKDDQHYAHFRMNHNFYKQLFEWFNHNLAHQQRTNISCLLKILPNTAIIISAFQNDVDHALRADRKYLLANDDNFILINTNLHRITVDELSGSNKQFFDFHKFFGGECRHSHLSKSNNIILADQLYQCLVHKTNKYFDASKFKKNFLCLELTDENKKVFDEELLPIWKNKFRIT